MILYFLNSPTSPPVPFRGLTRQIANISEKYSSATWLNSPTAATRNESPDFFEASLAEDLEEEFKRQTATQLGFNLWLQHSCTSCFWVQPGVFMSQVGLVSADEFRAKWGNLGGMELLLSLLWLSLDDDDDGDYITTTINMTMTMTIAMAMTMTTIVVDDHVDHDDPL